MRRFRWFAAAITFLSAVLATIVLVFLDIKYPDNSLIRGAACLVDLPGIPFIFLFPGPMGAGGDHTWDYIVCSVIGSFSGIVWGTLAGFVFGRTRSAKDAKR